MINNGDLELAAAAADLNMPPPPDNTAMEEDSDGLREKDIWPDDNGDGNAAAILDVDPSIFYADFPPMPEFPCMSSSSSSSPSTPAVPALSVDRGLGDIDQVMENLSYIDLIDTSDIWDPSSVFQTDNPEDENNTNGGGFASFLEGNSELSVIFFDWLKQNRDVISADDMRNIKLRRSTIECASKRLGTNREGRKQLLTLILQWVELHRLRKRANPNPNPTPTPNNVPYSPFNPLTPDPNCCFSPAPWAAMYSTPMPGGGGADNFMPQVVNGIPYQHAGEYSGMDPAQSWPMSPPLMPQYNSYPDNGNMMNHQFQAVYGNPNNYQMFAPNGERLVRLGAAATKEARKRRMARQRQLHSHHRHGSNSLNRLLVQTSDQGDHHVGNGGHENGKGLLGNCAYWTGTDGLQAAKEDCQTVQSQKPSGSDRRQQQGWKPEKSFKFLLQKVLKQSDVGNLGRIVLPKREAESHLPELETRDGITIPMEDIATSRVWNIRYRFWPNNKSRMYLLENTGDFVRANRLQEGDFIVLYMDTKCGKYLIRGVKVPQPGTKPEAKKQARRNTRNESVAGNTSSSPVPIKQAAR